MTIPRTELDGLTREEAERLREVLRLRGEK